VVFGIINSRHVAQRFKHLLDTFRHQDDRRWSGAELAKATGGVASRSYATNLRKGRIDNPGYEKLRAITKAMGFAPERGSIRASATGHQSYRTAGAAATLAKSSTSSTP